MCIMVAGLYRLRVWGVVGMLAVNVLVTTFAFAGFFVGWSGVVGLVFLCTTVIQFLLGARLAHLVRQNLDATQSNELRTTGEMASTDLEGGVIMSFDDEEDEFRGSAEALEVNTSVAVEF